jgi:hypothetical protein
MHANTYHFEHSRPYAVDKREDYIGELNRASRPSAFFHTFGDSESIWDPVLGGSFGSRPMPCLEWSADRVSAPSIDGSRAIGGVYCRRLQPYSCLFMILACRQLWCRQGAVQSAVIVGQ